MLLSLKSVTVKSRKLIVTICLLTLVVFTGCKKEVSDGRNSQDIYVAISDQTLRLPYNLTLGLFRNGEAVSKKNTNSIEDPLQVDQVSFLEDVVIPGYEKSYKIQYLLTVDGKSTNVVLRDIKSELETKGIKLEDLPKKNGFYKYTYSEENGLSHYISANSILTNSDGEPLVLQMCGKGKSVLECQINFDWKSDIKVNVRENEFGENIPKQGSLDIWLEIYPIYQKQLEQHIVNTKDK